MNMKKIIAGTAAGALAVSAMATGAYAVDLTQAGATVYNATLAVKMDGTVNGGDSIKFEAPVGAEIKDDNGNTTGKVTIEGYKVSVSVVCGKDIVTKEKSQNKDNAGKPIEFTTAIATAFTDFMNVAGSSEGGALWQATVTIELSSTRKDWLKASDSTNEYLSGDFYPAGKVTMNDNTTEDSSVPSSGVTIGVSGSGADKIITRQEARALSANGGTITLTASNWGNASNITVNALPTIIRMTVQSSLMRDPISLTGVLEPGNNKKVTFALPAGLTVGNGDEVENFGMLTLSFTPDSGHTSENSWNDGWNFYGYELTVNEGSVPSEITTTTTATTESTTTTPASSSGDTTTTPPEVTADPSITASATETQAPVVTQAPAVTGNTGNTGGSGSDKNQPTGVALAFVPAIIAAAGVIISKKRK